MAAMKKAMEKMQAGIFERNRRLLAKRFPSAARYVDRPSAENPFEAFVAADVHQRQAIWIKADGSPAHLLYDAGEGERLLQKMAATDMPEPYDVVIILGMGLGRAGLEAVDRYTNRPRIVIIEPYPAVFTLALQTTDIGRLLEYDRLSLYLGDHAQPQSIIDALKQVLPIGRTLLFMHPYRPQAAGAAYRKLEADLVNGIRSTRDVWHTTRRCGRQMLSNTIANLPRLLGGTPFRALRHRFTDVPAICVAAGPSLNQALPLLKEAGNALLIACDSAVNALVQAGIQPHVVATADIHAGNSAKVTSCVDRLRDTVLAFGVESNPETVRSFRGRRRTGVTAYSRLVLDWFDPALDLRCRMPAMTSVTHLAVALAAAMGADPIVLVGVDLAYLDGQSHAAGTVFSHIPRHETLIPVGSADGSIAYAPPQLVTDRLVLEDFIARQSCRTISTSLHGALIHGAELKALRTVIDIDLAAPQDIGRRLDGISWTPPADTGAIAALLATVTRRFEALAAECHRGHARIVEALKARRTTEPDRSFQMSYSAVMSDYAALHRRCHSLIAGVQDIMLDDLQAITRKEAIATVQSYVREAERQAVMLGHVGARCRAIQSAVEFLLNRLAPLAMDSDPCPVAEGRSPAVHQRHAADSVDG